MERRVAAVAEWAAGGGWAGAPPLVAWYERQGFARSGTFEVTGWKGQVFSMEVG